MAPQTPQHRLLPYRLSCLGAAAVRLERLERLGRPHVRGSRLQRPRHHLRHRQQLLPGERLGIGRGQLGTGRRHRRQGGLDRHRSRRPAACDPDPGRHHQLRQQLLLWRLLPRPGVHPAQLGGTLRVRRGLRSDFGRARPARLGPYKQLPQRFGVVDPGAAHLSGNPGAPVLQRHHRRHGDRPLLERRHRRHRGLRRGGEIDLGRQPRHRSHRTGFQGGGRTELHYQWHRRLPVQHGLPEPPGDGDPGDRRHPRECCQRRQGGGDRRHPHHGLPGHHPERGKPRRGLRRHRGEHRGGRRLHGRLPRGELRPRRPGQRRGGGDRRQPPGKLCGGERRRHESKRPEHGGGGRRQLRPRGNRGVRLDPGHPSRLPDRRLRRRLGPLRPLPALLRRRRRRRNQQQRHQRRRPRRHDEFRRRRRRPGLRARGLRFRGRHHQRQRGQRQHLRHPAEHPHHERHHERRRRRGGRGGLRAPLHRQRRRLHRRHHQRQGGGGGEQRPEHGRSHPLQPRPGRGGLRRLRRGLRLHHHQLPRRGQRTHLHQQHILLAIRSHHLPGRRLSGEPGSGADHRLHGQPGVLPAPHGRQGDLHPQREPGGSGQLHHHDDEPDRLRPGDRGDRQRYPPQQSQLQLRRDHLGGAGRWSHPHRGRQSGAGGHVPLLGHLLDSGGSFGHGHLHRQRRRSHPPGHLPEPGCGDLQRPDRHGGRANDHPRRNLRGKRRRHGPRQQLHRALQHRRGRDGAKPRHLLQIVQPDQHRHRRHDGFDRHGHRQRPDRTHRRLLHRQLSRRPGERRCPRRLHHLRRRQCRRRGRGNLLHPERSSRPRFGELPGPGDANRAGFGTIHQHHRGGEPHRRPEHHQHRRGGGNAPGTARDRQVLQPDRGEHQHQRHPDLRHKQPQYGLPDGP